MHPRRRRAHDIHRKRTKDILAGHVSMWARHWTTQESSHVVGESKQLACAITYGVRQNQKDTTLHICVFIWNNTGKINTVMLVKREVDVLASLWWDYMDIFYEETHTHKLLTFLYSYTLIQNLIKYLTRPWIILCFCRVLHNKYYNIRARFCLIITTLSLNLDACLKNVR